MRLMKNRFYYSMKSADIWWKCFRTCLRKKFKNISTGIC